MLQSPTERWLNVAFDRPERGLWALIVAQAAFWTLAPALSHSAPPLDVVEMYAWGREGVVATFKHPNLPGLVLEGVRRATGIAGWPAYLVSQIFVAVTFWAVFALGRDMMDGRRALAGVLLLTGVYFFSWPTPEFNHNVAQMPFWALIALFTWRATTRGHWLYWVLLGLCGGVSLWAKYSSAVILLVAAIWILWDSQARRALLRPGPYLALLAFALSAAPQVTWLLAHDFQPFAYAARRAARDASIFAPFEFLIAQALHHLPMLILLAAAGIFGARAADAPPKPEQRSLRFLLLFGLGPVLITAAAALFAGAGLKTAWGAAMFNLSGLLVVALLWDRVAQARLNRIAWGAGVLIVLLSGLYFAHMRYGALLTGDPLRGNWPQAQISRALERSWESETGGAPLRIVAGDIWTAGLVGMDDPSPPSVLINGDLTISPWISPANLDQNGALYVWRADDEAPFAEPTNASARGSITAPMRRFPNAVPIRIEYAIVAPKTDY